MNGSGSDRLNRWLHVPATRRAALAGAGAWVSSVVATRGAFAAQATPVDAEEPVLLFVQTFASGRGQMNHDGGTPDGGPSVLLTLEGHTGQTIYFSDRPDRIVGASRTEDFLDRVGFPAANPPNAALVAEFAAGQGVVVLELFAPDFDSASGTLRYDVQVLEAYEGERLVPVLADQVAARLPATFGPAALFIDSETYGDYYIVK